MPVFYVQGQVLTFNGCRAVLGEPTACEQQTCDNSGRDIEIVSAVDLVPYVKAETAYKEGASIYFADNSVIEQHIAWALTEFTQRTGILQRKAKMDVQKGVRDYYITPPPGEEIGAVYSVCVNGDCLESAQRERCCSGKHCMSPRRKFVFHPQDKIVLDEASCNECGSIDVQYETFASNTACTIDKLILTRHQRAIVAGAAAGIRKMAGFGWSLPAKGMDLEREFKIAITRAQISEANGYTNGQKFAVVWGEHEAPESRSWRHYG